ncbi:ethyl tert-butyl ether degradation protein EthD [Nocardiopsis terrae]
MGDGKQSAKDTARPDGAPAAEPGAGADGADTAELENAAELTLSAFCWWRSDLPQEVCEDYWRDVHGIMFARVPGLWQLRQLRLAANRSDLWPGVRGVSFEVPDAAQPRGLPHGLFRSEAELAAFAGHPMARETIPDDAHNFLGRIGAQLSPPGGGRTLLDRSDAPAVQGPPPVPTFVLCFVPRAGVASTEEFHRYLAEHVARPWSGHPSALRVRVEPLPPYARSAMGSPGVPHQWPNDQTYLGWIELAVRDRGAVGGLLAGTATGELSELVRAVHTYPVREIHTLIRAGRPTEVGLRGYPAVRAITAAGADNQRDEDLLHDLFGDAVRGLDQLRRRPESSGTP